MNSTIRLLFYILVAAGMAFFRYSLDSERPYISSDGQIKYFQTVQYASDPLDVECIYPARHLDPEFHFYPFDRPWGYLNTAGFKCVSQYPPFFSYLGTILYVLVGEKAPLQLPIVFTFFALILFDKILTSRGVAGSITAIAGIFLFAFSHVFLSAIDYSEMSLFHFLLMAGLYVLSLSLDHEFNGEARISLVPRGGNNFPGYAFFFGFLMALSVFIRTEVAVFLIIALVTVVFLFFRPGRLLSLFVPVIAGALVAAILFVVFNIIVFGHPLDIRARTFVDMAGQGGDDAASLKKRIFILLGYFYKTDIKKGLFYAFPFYYIIPVFFLPFLFRRMEVYGRFLLLAGFLTVTVSGLIAPSIGGVGLFGLRYLDAGFLVMVAGLGFAFHSLLKSPYKYLKYGIIFLFLLTGIRPAYRFWKEGVSQLTTGSRMYNLVQEEFAEAGFHGGVIHTGIDTAYMIGYSFLQQQHVLVLSQKELHEIEKRFRNSRVNRYVLVRPVTKPPINPSVPREMYPRLYTDFPIISKFYKKVGEKDLFGYRFYSFER